MCKSGTPAVAAERFDNAFFVHATTHAFEQMIGAMCIVVGGILELYPKLKVAFLEAGAGWVPYWMERLDEHYECLQPTVPLIKNRRANTCAASKSITRLNPMNIR